jgi:AraC family transcriptional regulator
MDSQQLQAMNRTLDYIQLHLADALSVATLAQVACYSEFHFQRLFKTHVGESVQRYVNRKRLERAAELLRTQPNVPITEIALKSGFSTSAAFAKAFKQQFELSATQWRTSHSDLYQTPNERRFELSIKDNAPYWLWRSTDERIFSQLTPHVHLETMPGVRVAYVRNVGQYMQNETLFSMLYQRLFQWAGSHGALNDETQAYNFYSDSPDITDGDKLQVLAAITVDDHVKPKGDIGTKKLPGGLYAVSRFRLNNDNFKYAWDWLYNQWLPESGFHIDDRASFERDAGGAKLSGEYLVDIGVPVVAS